MPENTRSTNHTYNEGRYSGVPGSGRSQTENTRSSEYDKLFGYEFGEGDWEGFCNKLDAYIASKVEEARENAFSGGFGAGGGEVHNLELAWKLYNEALQSKEGEL